MTPNNILANPAQRSCSSESWLIMNNVLRNPPGLMKGKTPSTINSNASAIHICFHMRYAAWGYRPGFFRYLKKSALGSTIMMSPLSLKLSLYALRLRYNE